MREILTPAQIEKLVGKSQQGCEKSFGRLFDLFFDKIFRYIQFRVAENEAEDLTSDVFLKVVENIKSYKTTKNASFSAWIFRIAHNTVIDFYRRKKELLGLNDETNEDFFLQIPDENPRPDEQTNTYYDIQKLKEALKSLPDNQREILEFKYLEGFSNTEIAHITGKSEGNIRVLQLRALREIRKKWET
ncbi:RNA polymerase sigma factor [Candidatus Gracilibacteria bacterium]|nr:RNA polymerase sigma factor [Candidatus Gracilibacteria bacterium]